MKSRREGTVGVKYVEMNSARSLQSINRDLGPKKEDKKIIDSFVGKTGN